MRPAGSRRAPGRARAPAPGAAAGPGGEAGVAWRDDPARPHVLVRYRLEEAP
jgi:hypothetical protein